MTITVEDPNAIEGALIDVGVTEAESLDLGGAYRVSRNLDVTAGVRLSEEQDARLSPLTDGADDSQSVYIGTQLRF